MKFLALAGNHNQFEDFVRSNDRERLHYKYVSRIEDTYGMRGVGLVFIGTYYEAWSQDEINRIIENIAD